MVEDLSYVSRKLANHPSRLFRQFVVSERDSEHSIVGITAEMFSSSYGNTLFLRCDNSSILVGGEVFGAQSLTVLENAEDETDFPVVVMGNRFGFSVITYDDIIESLEVNAHVVRGVQVYGYWPCGDWFQSVAEPDEPTAFRHNSEALGLFAENEVGEIVLMSYEQLTQEGDDLLSPRVVGESHNAGVNDWLHVDDMRSVVGVSSVSDSLSASESVVPCWNTNYGSSSALFSEQRSVDFTVTCLCADDLSVRASAYRDDTSEGILFENLAANVEQSVSLYLHGGPTHYFSNPYEYVSADDQLYTMLSKSRFVYLPFLERSTDYGTPEDFFWNGDMSSVQILGSQNREAENILISCQTIATTNNVTMRSAYAVSMGGYIAAAMLAQHVGGLWGFNSMVMVSPLLNVEDPLNHESYTANQRIGLRKAVQNQTVVSTDLIGSEEWVQLLSDEDRSTSVSVVLSDSDPICSADTAADFCELLSVGGIDATVYLDSEAEGHDISVGASLYTSAQL